MKLISTPTELNKEFERLLNQYTEYFWTSAWAGSSSELFQVLKEKQDNISKIIIGIHFYQTHPDFIETFIDNKNVRFIKQPAGTFHPKLYIFYNDVNNWEILIGSANFTNAAFTINSEVSLLLTNFDTNCAQVFGDGMKFVNECWKHANYFSRSELDNYRITWKNHKPKINSLSGKYGTSNAKTKTKPIYEIPVINMNWNKYMEKVRNETIHSVKSRLEVIEIAKKLFEKKNHFNQMTEDERKFIAGIPNKLKGGENWAYFGSMMGNGIFKNRIIENNINISLALDQIPLSGQITRTNYTNFLKYYKATFSGNYIATATRLLSMKRPDIFVCFDSKNKSNLCKDFGIQQSGMNYDRYWDDIIERIYDSDWWLNSEPKDNIEEQVSLARAAFLDSIYYEG